MGLYFRQPEFGFEILILRIALSETFSQKRISSESVKLNCSPVPPFVLHEILLSWFLFGLLKFSVFTQVECLKARVILIVIVSGALNEELLKSILQ